jgi:hypothetical protein
MIIKILRLMKNLKLIVRVANLVLCSMVFFLATLLSGCNFSTDTDHVGDDSPHTISYLRTASIIDGTTKVIARAERAIFIPTTAKILYCHQDSLFTINYDGSQKLFVAFVPGIDAYSLEITNDGRAVIAATQLTSAYQKYSGNTIVKIDVISKTVETIYRDPSMGVYRPHFYMNDSKIIFEESTRNGLSSINIDGSGYAKVTPDHRYNIFLGATPDSKYLILIGHAYSSMDSSATTLLTVKADSYTVIDSSFLAGDYLDWTSARVTNDLIVYYKTRYIIAKYDLATKSRSILYTGYLNTDIAFSLDLSKAVFDPQYGTPSVLNLETGELTSYSFPQEDIYGYYYGGPQISPDDKYFLIISSYTYWGSGTSSE